VYYIKATLFKSYIKKKDYFVEVVLIKDIIIKLDKKKQLLVNLALLVLKEF
jgi:hypothetical protein